MDFNSWFLADSDVFTWVILPILICLARITDQSIGTLRLILVSKGYKFIAPFLAFFESLIWLLAVSQILKHLDNWVTFVAYGLGFALGNYIGIILEEKISLGNVIVRVFPKTDHAGLIEYMNQQNIGYSIIDAEGRMGGLKIIFSIIGRKSVSAFVQKIEEFTPGSFYSIEEVKSVKKGIFQPTRSKTQFKSVFGSKKTK
ncbi:MAG: DUF5698 domain-containing protein [Bacteroidota bacterium]|jgi:uncharacterized protein YebE (UPF0316 family)